MSDPTIAGLARTLSQALSILEAHSDKLAELEQRESLVLDGLNLIFDSARYSEFFQTEGQALIAYNLMQKARDRKWEAVSQLPKHLRDRRARAQDFDPSEAAE